MDWHGEGPAAQSLDFELRDRCGDKEPANIKGNSVYVRSTKYQYQRSDKGKVD